MKVLFATTNPAKIKKYAEKLKEKNIDILTIKDLGINLKPEEKQPGTHVRRVNEKELNGDEMIEYYCNLVKEYSWSKSHFYFVGKPCEKRNPGYPLDSMSIMPECNKYFVDLTEEDRNRNKENYKEDDVIDFIVNNCSK